MRFRVVSLLLLGLVCLGAVESSAAEIRNVNFAVFQKQSDDFEFEAIVLGKFSDFIDEMKGAQVLLISHTTDSIDGDVINVQQDVLRDSEGDLTV